MLSYFRRKGSIYFFGKPKKICNLCGFDTFNTSEAIFAFVFFTTGLPDQTETSATPEQVQPLWRQKFGQGVRWLLYVVKKEYSEFISYSLNNQRPPAEQSWGYEDGPWKGPGPPLLGAADF